MATKTYVVSLQDGDTFRFQMDRGNAAEPITCERLEGRGFDDTPYQTADARHNCIDAARLLIGFLNSEGAALAEFEDVILEDDAEDCP